MKNSKEEAISNLYTIRAGLSSISLAKSKIDECNKDKESLKKNKLKKENDIKIEEARYSTVSYQQKEYKKKLPSIGDLFLFVDFKDLMEMVGGIFFLGVFIYGIIFVLHFFIKSMSKINFTTLAIWFAVGFIGGGILLFLLTAILESVSFHRSERKKAYSEDAAVIMKNIDTHKNELVVSTAQYEEDVKLKDKEIELYIQVAKSIYDALVDKFQNFLNPVDWANIDLAIYYLQTGRADTIKEALNLIDRQRQTDDIINEIKSATSTITNEIRRDFVILSKSIDNNFNKLSTQLEKQHAEVIGSLKSMEDSLATIKEQNVALITQSQKQVESLYDFGGSLQLMCHQPSTVLQEDLVYMQRLML